MAWEGIFLGDKAILVQKEAHLLELSRDGVLNSVSAKMVALPQHWPWSSYLLCANDEFTQPWLDTDWLLGQFGSERDAARRAYEEFVLAGVVLASPLLTARH